MEIFIVCAVALACSIANVDSATRIVGSTDLAYYKMVPNIFCNLFIPSGSDGFELSFFGWLLCRCTVFLWC